VSECPVALGTKHPMQALSWSDSMHRAAVQLHCWLLFFHQSVWGRVVSNKCWACSCRASPVVTAGGLRQQELTCVNVTGLQQCGHVTPFALPERPLSDRLALTLMQKRRSAGAGAKPDPGYAPGCLRAAPALLARAGTNVVQAWKGVVATCLSQQTCERQAWVPAHVVQCTACRCQGNVL
jgi:hypothetical protein